MIFLLGCSWHIVSYQNYIFHLTSVVLTTQNVISTIYLVNHCLLRLTKFQKLFKIHRYLHCSNAEKDLSVGCNGFLLLGSYLHYGFRQLQRDSCFRHRIRYFRHRSSSNQQCSQSNSLFRCARQNIGEDWKVQN